MSLMQMENKQVSPQKCDAVIAQFKETIKQLKAELEKAQTELLQTKKALQKTQMDLEDAEEREQLVVAYNKNLLLKFAEIDEERTATVNLRQGNTLSTRSQSTIELSSFERLSNQDCCNTTNQKRETDLMTTPSTSTESIRALNLEENSKVLALRSASSDNLSSLEIPNVGTPSASKPPTTSRTIAPTCCANGCHPNRCVSKMSENVIQLVTGERTKALGMVQALKDGLLFGTLAAVVRPQELIGIRACNPDPAASQHHQSSTSASGPPAPGVESKGAGAGGGGGGGGGGVVRGLVHARSQSWDSTIEDLHEPEPLSPVKTFGAPPPPPALALASASSTSSLPSRHHSRRSMLRSFSLFGSFSRSAPSYSSSSSYSVAPPPAGVGAAPCAPHGLTRAASETHSHLPMSDHVLHQVAEEDDDQKDIKRTGVFHTIRHRLSFHGNSSPSLLSKAFRQESPFVGAADQQRSDGSAAAVAASTSSCSSQMERSNSSGTLGGAIRALSRFPSGGSETSKPAVGGGAGERKQRKKGRWEIVWKEGGGQGPLRRLTFEGAHSRYEHINKTLESWSAAFSAAPAEAKDTGNKDFKHGSQSRDRRDSSTSNGSRDSPRDMGDTASPASSGWLGEGTGVGSEEAKSMMGIPLDGKGSYLPHCSHPSRLLDEAALRGLAVAIPARFRQSAWTLLYSTWKDGTSLATLMRKTAKETRLPCITVIRDAEGHIFGGFTSQGWHISQRYFGSGEAFVFQIHPRPVMYRWSKLNNYFQFGSVDSIAIGGGGHFSVWLDSDLLWGNSGRCDTFCSPCLASSEEFRCSSVEVWGVGW